MTNSIIIRCIIFIVSAQALNTEELSSTRRSMSMAALSASMNYLDFVIDVKERNDKIDIMNTEELLEEIASAADAIHQEMMEKDLDILPIRSDLEKKEMADCEKNFLDWRTVGNQLWTLYTECRYKNSKRLADAAIYTEILNEHDPTFVTLKQYREILGTCFRGKDTSPEPQSRNCDKAFEGLQFVESIRLDLNKYLEASAKREQVRREIRSVEKCANAVDVHNFYEKGKSIVSETANCISKKRRTSHHSI